jgi:competence/damage-inducible protein CinA-like protein
MPVAEIIAIGTELLLGEIQDTNTQYLARTLRDKGIDIFRATLVGDNATRISNLIREAAGRADIVITTGGLGPTVDDPTRDAAALAMGVTSQFSPELWQQIEARFSRMGRTPTENNKRQAYLPSGSQAIENPVGTAPAFFGEVGSSILVCLPGVPREMEYLVQSAVLPLLENRFNLHETIRALVLHTAGVGESQVDELVGDLETGQNPTVGLLAHPGMVDIRITAKAASLTQAENMIAEMASGIHERLGEAIFGQDGDTLEGVICGLLGKPGKTLVISSNLNQSRMIDRLTLAGVNSIRTIDLPEGSFEQMMVALKDEIKDSVDVIGLAIASTHSDALKRNQVEIAIISSRHLSTEIRHYGGPEGSLQAWAANLALNQLRLHLLTLDNDKEK